MKFGRFTVACSHNLLGFLLVVFCSSAFTALAQQAPASAENSGQGLPAAVPLSQAAVGTAPHGDSPTPALSAPAAGATTSSHIESSPTLRLGSGDLIDIAVYNVPELATKARIGNSGDIYLPLIDYVHVGDLTLEEAQTLIQKRLEDGGFVRNPHVTIFLDESISQGVTILGEVVRPGIYPVLGNRKLFDVLSAAGGFSAAAGRKVSIVRAQGQGSPITVSLPRNLAEDWEDDIAILPGDTITVPRAPIIYVVGEVGRPAGLLVDNGNLTVLQALALAGGLNHTAKMGGTAIIRRGPNGMTQTKIPLKKMLEAKAPDLNLQADDILFVPLSGIKLAGGQALSAAISSTTGLAVLAVHP